MLRTLLLRQARQIASHSSANSALRLENASLHTYTRPARSLDSIYRSPANHLQFRPKNQLADKLTDVIPRPRFIPRPVVRGLVGIFGARFVWKTVRRFFSRSILFSAVSGGVYFLYKLKFPDSKESASQSEEGEDNSLLASAQGLLEKVTSDK